MTTTEPPPPGGGYSPHGKPPPEDDKAFFGQPKGLQTLFATEFWERYSFYGMRGLLVLFLTDTVANHGLGFSTKTGNSFLGIYNSLVYLMALPGGWIADRIWGARRSVLWGGIVIAAGHYVMVIPTKGTTFLGLALIVLGTGLLKPNISAQVGDLYHTHDTRRDTGFTIFYMAINMGAFLAPLTAGWVGQHVNYHLGFGCAAIGMTFAVVFYIAQGKHLGTVGMWPPKPIAHRELRRTLLLTGLVLLVVVAIVVGWMAFTQWSVAAFSDALAAPIIATPFLYFGYMFGRGGLSSGEAPRLWAFVAFFIGATVFWMIYDQSGSQLNLFAADKTNLSVFGWQMPAVWLQSANPFYIMVFAPIFAWMWERLGDRAPRTTVKFAIALIFIGLSFFVMSLAGKNATPTHKASIAFLAVTYLLQTLGELCLSPVGLSVTTQLAPARFAGQMLGLWFLATAVGNALNVYVTKLSTVVSDFSYFLSIGCVALGMGVIAFLTAPFINRLMGDIR
ncbi:peptide MFS transporter [Catenulispora subtropica]|uniref:Peptide MFS transporter n=1 Tax=Catenulispora subtropica TaxID=450798 RepID=A0ABP5EQC5_9ACTN